MNYDVRWVRGHVEVFSPLGKFLFSADSWGEAMAELANAAA